MSKLAYNNTYSSMRLNLISIKESGVSQTTSVSSDALLASLPQNIAKSTTSNYTKQNSNNNNSYETVFSATLIRSFLHCLYHKIYPTILRFFSLFSTMEAFNFNINIPQSPIACMIFTSILCFAVLFSNLSQQMNGIHQPISISKESSQLIINENGCPWKVNEEILFNEDESNIEWKRGFVYQIQNKAQRVLIKRSNCWFFDCYLFIQINNEGISSQIKNASEFPEIDLELDLDNPENNKIAVESQGNTEAAEKLKLSLVSLERIIRDLNTKVSNVERKMLSNEKKLTDELRSVHISNTMANDQMHSLQKNMIEMDSNKKVASENYYKKSLIQLESKMLAMEISFDNSLEGLKQKSAAVLNSSEMFHMQTTDNNTKARMGAVENVVRNLESTMQSSFHASRRELDVFRGDLKHILSRMQKQNLLLAQKEQQLSALQAKFDLVNKLISNQAMNFDEAKKKIDSLQQSNNLLTPNLSLPFITDNKPDFASSVEYHTDLQTSNYVSWFRMRFGNVFGSRYSQKCVRPTLKAGDCVPLLQFQGAHIVIKLIQAVHINGITLEYIHRSLVLDAASSPKDFSLQVSEHGKRYLKLKSFSFDPLIDSEKKLYSFDATSVKFRYVKFNVLSNWGSGYTCLYRVQVHGNLNL